MWPGGHWGGWPFSVFRTDPSEPGFELRLALPAAGLVPARLQVAPSRSHPEVRIVPHIRRRLIRGADSNRVWLRQPPVLLRQDRGSASKRQGRERPQGEGASGGESRLHKPTRRLAAYPSGMSTHSGNGFEPRLALPAAGLVPARHQVAPSRSHPEVRIVPHIRRRLIRGADSNRVWLRQPPVLLRREIKSRLRRPNSEVGRSPYLAAAHQGTGFEPRLAAPAAGLAPAGHLVLPPQAHSEVRILIRADMRRAPRGVPFAYLVGARGFEPPTSRSRTERSTRLSHAPTKV